MLADGPETSYGPGVQACGKSNPAKFKDAEAGRVGRISWNYFDRATSNSSVKITTGMIRSMV